MRRRESAGILLYRRAPAGLEVFLIHPGGPLFAGRDDGVWSLPKGEIEPGEEPLAVALREFEEETGQPLSACASPGMEPLALGSVIQAGGKRVHAWAVEGDWPPGAVFASNSFSLEWPPRSGRRSRFPEADAGGFLDLPTARRKVNAAQAELLDRLVGHLGV